MWYDTWHALLDFHRRSEATRPPPEPYPAVAWTLASDQMKQHRWEATVAWARAYGVEDLLLGTED